ncbi:MAG: V-type ATPase subunit [Lachnospiraceae bacterium]|nr:V-type ATPase subunit [Lachnospiraceae bacterium]
MSDNKYIYAVARIRSKELTLLNTAFMEQLVSAKGVSEAMSLLAEKGWSTGETGTSDFEQMLRSEEERTWDLIAELVKDMSVFDVFLYANDYHNLKAAIKEACSSQETPGIYISRGSIPVDTIKSAVSERDFSRLPERMREVASKAMDTLLHTRDGQICDAMVDRAALCDILRAGKESGSKILSDYGELTVATADIKIALRAAKTKKDAQFLKEAIAPCDTLDHTRLIETAAKGEDEVLTYLSGTVYSDAIDMLSKSASAFEKWCDDKMMDSIRQELYHPFTIGPLAAYILARQSEIRSVRIILTGKANDLSEETIRERIRATYV